MGTQGGFLITRIKQVGGRVFERILAEKKIDAFNGAQGRILYVLWQKKRNRTGVDNAYQYARSHGGGFLNSPRPR